MAKEVRVPIKQFTDEQLRILQQVVDEYKRRKLDESIPTFDEGTDVTPEVYVCKPPAGGIPPLETISGEDVPGSAECDIYKLSWLNATQYKMEATIYGKTVYNISRAWVDVEYKITWRDKYGRWVVEELSTTPTGTGSTGTGSTGTGSTGTGSTGTGTGTACGTFTIYRYECVSGVLREYQSIVSFTAGCPTQTAWEYVKDQGCCDCNVWPPPTGTGSTGTGTGTGTGGCGGICTYNAQYLAGTSQLYWNLMISDCLSGPPCECTYPTKTPTALDETTTTKCRRTCGFCLYYWNNVLGYWLLVPNSSSCNNGYPELPDCDHACPSDRIYPGEGSFPVGSYHGELRRFSCSSGITGTGTATSCSGYTATYMWNALTSLWYELPTDCSRASASPERPSPPYPPPTCFSTEPGYSGSYTGQLVNVPCQDLP